MFFPNYSFVSFIVIQFYFSIIFYCGKIHINVKFTISTISRCTVALSTFIFCTTITTIHS